MSSNLSLVISLVSLVSWVVLAFIVRLEAGSVHLLLALGVGMAVRWWALRPETS